MSTALEMAKRMRDGMIASASRTHDESYRLHCLKKAVEAQELIAAEDKKEQDARTPCLLCGRKVKVPCNTVENIYESGPWDTFCNDYKG